MGAAEELHQLRADLERRFGQVILPRPSDATAPNRPGFHAGIHALDRILPDGVPRGLLSVLSGPATSGRTAAVRSLVAAACAAGALVALVDATRSLDPASWCDEGGSMQGLWVVRPPSADRALEGLWVGEMLLRAAAFELVVIDGPPPEPAQAYRLRALARETDAALLLSTDLSPSGWRADVRLEFRPGEHGAGLTVGGRFRRRSRMHAAKTGGHATGEREVELIHDPPHRLHSHSPLADRRPGRDE